MAEQETKSRISRRQFLTAAGAGVAAGAVVGIGGTVGFSRMSSASAGLPSKWDKTADVVVVGSGGAGLTAAAMAASKGSSVIVLEKASIHGGTTPRPTGGGFPTTHL